LGAFGGIKPVHTPNILSAKQNVTYKMLV
jgi:hypothetical protein